MSKIAVSRQHLDLDLDLDLDGAAGVDLPRRGRWTPAKTKIKKFLMFIYHNKIKTNI